MNIKEEVATAIRSLEDNGELPEWMEAVFAPLKCERR